VPAISEYGGGGALLFDAHLALDLIFYRGYRFAWSGHPLTPPAVAASLNNTAEETIVHMSFNGATDVASWRVLAGGRPQSLTAAATVPVSGFETSTVLPQRYSYVAVQALDSAGRVLGTSRSAAVSSLAASLPTGSAAG
jgi:hypothetical protein